MGIMQMAGLSVSDSVSQRWKRSVPVSFFDWNFGRPKADVKPQLEVSNVPTVPCHFSFVPIVLRVVPGPFT